MAKKTLVIEINDKITRISEILGAKKGINIANSASFLTPFGSVQDGTITDMAALGNAIKHNLEKSGIRAKNAVFSITSGRIALREITVPNIKESKIRSFILANASEYFPVDLSNYHINYSIAGPVTTNGQNLLKIMVYATPLTLVENYFKLAEALQLKVLSIDYPGNGTFVALKQFSTEEVSMFAHIDAQNTYAYILQKGNLLLQRSLNFGGDDLLADFLRYSGRKEENYLEALAELCSNDADKIHGYISDAAVDGALERLVSGISRSMGFYNANNRDNLVTKVYISGMFAPVFRLKGLLQAACSLDVDFVETIENTEKIIPNIKNVGPLIGALGGFIEPLNIMPEKLSAKKKKPKVEKRRTIFPGVLTACIGVLICAGLLVFAFRENSIAKHNLDEIRSQIEARQQAEETYNNYKNHLLAYDGFNQLFAEKDTPLNEISAFLTEFESKMPKSLLIVSASADKEGISLNLTVKSKEDAALTIVQLKTFDSIKSVTVSSITEQTDQSGAGYVNFAVSCLFGRNPHTDGN